ncbi:tetratricopeptide repeat protein [Halomonas getboli]|uniref:tetratricopeptide repeat protein n=1 Tax=Halomonas getboli TaxID=2935862 RepID=UPI001FFFF565|nr:tetratricopeptide repeat protein [Halomonas getboli]MCK2183434.1 tetratricopeptide repeat protein [Halomonas getboli]
MTRRTMRRKWRNGLIPLALLALTGCAGGVEPMAMVGLGGGEEAKDVTGPCGEHYSADIGLRLDMIRQQMEQGRSRSALAHLDESGFDYAEAALMRGDALRDVGRRDESDAVYETLAGGCLAADAFHGMARNAVVRGDRQQALVLMRQARDARPTDADIRNDLGYLLMLEGEPQQAREELLTALELGGAGQRAASNLVMLMMQQGRVVEAERLARRYDVDDELVARLRRLSSGGAGPEHG